MNTVSIARSRRRTPTMISSFFPVKKLRRNSKYLLWGSILVVGAVAMYYEFVGAYIWSAPRSPVGEDVIWRRSDQAAEADNQLDSLENSALWHSIHAPLPWKPEYKGQANLHIFEDWCGSSTAELRMNLHYPLYPHTRTTVEKLAVSPQWTNYGLRIFGYLHPFADGEYVFAVSSDDNSEFWLSMDDSLSVQLLAWVGKTGTEWTAPGEYNKYASQISRSVILSAQKRYFFEVLYKQNDRGTDHIEVAWQLNKEGWMFIVIESKHLSLYTNESTLLMSDVAHIPQTVASHTSVPSKHPNGNADMLRDDPRDSIYQVPLINSRHLRSVLPDCAYKPTYLIKGFPLLRYQGLQFVHMSYIYPNDYTRLTHMERENSCFYRESPIYLERYGFSRYMELDRPERGESEDKVFQFNRREREKRNNGLALDYGDDYDDYVQSRRRKIFSVGAEADLHPAGRRSTGGADALSRPAAEESVAPRDAGVPNKTAKEAVKESGGEPAPETPVARVNPAGPMNPEGEIKTRSAKRKRLKKIKVDAKPKHVEKEQPQPEGKERIGLKETPLGTSARPLFSPERDQRLKQSQPWDTNPAVPERRRVARPVAVRGSSGNGSTSRHADVRAPSLIFNQRVAVSMTTLMEREMEVNINHTFHRAMVTMRAKMDRLWRGLSPEDIHLDAEKLVNNKDFDYALKEKEDSFWVQGDSEVGNEDVSYDSTPPPPVDIEVNWRQTFRVNQLDLQATRSDWIDLHCNVSGNLMLHASDAQTMVKAFMDKLNQRHNGQFTLVRVINVEKRVDGTQGSRYLLELEVKNVHDQVLRLSHYIYALIRQKRQSSRDFQRTTPQVVLCNPVGFRWNPTATVHFIVPVKNQARWVRQLIVDMETLYRETGDTNFNLIIADYNSTDIDVEKALQTSTVFRYQYTKLTGNFERSAGLQAGINLIDDHHSIVFLCDLHIHFPFSVIDTIRKHCIESHMAFAPIVMRMDCGATPTDPRGYWEVNGFGLLGIYKSDLEAAGGMNTREFRDSWGGEDWELLDRILKSGLEVERIYLRNFFHHYHSKRGMWNHRMMPNPR